MSPIVGLTDTVMPSFPRLGKLRKGGEKQQRTRNGKTYEIYGEDLPYFRFTSDRPDVMAAFRQAYGDQPTALAVYLPYTTIEQNFATWKEKWARGGLEHRCDGVTMTIWQEAGKYVQGAKPCPYKDTPDHKDACKEIGRLTVILPELWRAGFVGYVTMETHSLHDIMNIQASLLATLEARGDNPMGLRGIEFTLRKSLETISTPGDGQRVSRDKYLVRLEPMATWASLQLQAAQQAAMGMLPAPRTVDQATGEIIDDLEPPEDVEEGEYHEVSEPEPKPEPPKAENPKIDWGAFRKAMERLEITSKSDQIILGTTNPAEYEKTHKREALQLVYLVVKAGIETGMSVTDICNALGVASVAEYADKAKGASLEDAKERFAAFIAGYKPAEDEGTALAQEGLL